MTHTKIELLDNIDGGESLFIDGQCFGDLRLIAAAPELLEALKQCKSEFIQMGCDEQDSIIMIIEQAIAKAQVKS